MPIMLRTLVHRYVENYAGIILDYIYLIAIYYIVYLLQFLFYYKPEYRYRCRYISSIIRSGDAQCKNIVHNLWNVHVQCC